ncbi:MAG: hypothetical protein JXR30_00320, partial [Alphaproteobacteria bacterium]|nr:hypothetical protein [Alphaproteobacteria bacterium]
FEEVDVPLEKAVLTLLSKTPSDIVDIAKHLCLSENQVRYILLILELEGKVKFLPQEKVIQL